MQNYGLIPELGMKPKAFWKKANQWSVDNCADQVTGSMYYFTKTAKEKGVKLTKENFFRCGQNIEYFEGVETWFERIDRFGAALDLEIEHYIISAGYEEIIAGCSIRKYFTDVFGCSYAYDEDGCPVWPARVVNYSTKTQYLSKINKGLGKLEDRAVNEFMPDDERPIPFTRMIYFGDGMTDIPSMRLVKERNGNAIAVYTPKSKNATMQSFYDVLGVFCNASDCEIKRRWKELIVKYHPDRLQARGASAEEIESTTLKMAEINNAYQAIMKSRKII